MSEREVLDALMVAWDEDIAPTVQRTSCILAARVASGVLDYYGIGHRVIAVEAFVMNQAAVECMGTDLPKEEWPDDAWVIGVKQGNPGPGYDGHLLVILDSGRILDLSARQFDRPARNLRVDGPRCWEPEDLALAWEPSTGHEDRPCERVVVVDGNVVYDWRTTPDQRWRKAPDWRSGPKLVGGIIRRLVSEGLDAGAARR